MKHSKRWKKLWRKLYDAAWMFCIYPKVDLSEGGIVVACDRFRWTDENYGMRKFSSKEKLVEFLQMSPRTDVISLFDGTSSFRQWLLSKGSKE